MSDLFQNMSDIIFFTCRVFFSLNYSASNYIPPDFEKTAEKRNFVTKFNVTHRTKTVKPVAHILAIRLSALGDVAMTVPAIHSLAISYPNDEITVVSRRKWGALFHEMPANVHFYGIDMDDYAGIRGLERLFRELQEMRFDCVADLHDVLRTKYLSLRFRMNHIPVVPIKKGRRAKKELTRRKNKRLKPLETSVQRYADVFARLGYPFKFNFTSIFGEEKGDVGTLAELVGSKNEDEWIGVAPFAQHKGKIYPPELTERVVSILCKYPRRRIFIFGGGEEEKNIALEWEKRYPAVTSMIGYGRMEDELGVLSRMDVVLSMDSANMHLASITGVPVVSIWGATHPYAGFQGWGQEPSNFIQADMDCRPCSVYGNRPCLRGDYACLTRISPDTVAEKIESIIEKRKLTNAK